MQIQLHRYNYIRSYHTKIGGPVLNIPCISKNIIRVSSAGDTDDKNAEKQGGAT
jgi:hypothetical protein